MQMKITDKCWLTILQETRQQGAFSQISYIGIETKTIVNRLQRLKSEKNKPHSQL